MNTNTPNDVDCPCPSCVYSTALWHHSDLHGGRQL